MSMILMKYQMNIDSEKRKLRIFQKSLNEPT